MRSISSTWLSNWNVQLIIMSAQLTGAQVIISSTWIYIIINAGLIESITTLWKGQGNPIPVSMICNPQRGLRSRGCCKSWTWGWDSLVPSEMWWLIIFLPFIVPRLSRKWGTLNLIRPSVGPSVCLSASPSVCHKNFNLAHIFWSVYDRALIFGMHDPCDKPFLLIPCGDLYLDIWPTSRSNLLPGGGPQFFKFACFS